MVEHTLCTVKLVGEHAQPHASRMLNDFCDLHALSPWSLDWIATRRRYGSHLDIDIGLTGNGCASHWHQRAEMATSLVEWFSAEHQRDWLNRRAATRTGGKGE